MVICYTNLLSNKCAFFEAQSKYSYQSLFPCSAISFRCATGMPLRPWLNTSELQEKPTFKAQTKSFSAFVTAKAGLKAALKH
jgi:hypothetical protein